MLSYDRQFNYSFCDIHFITVKSTSAAEAMVHGYEGEHITVNTLLGVVRLPDLETRQEFVDYLRRTADTVEGFNG